MADETLDWINEQTVGCCLVSAAMLVGIVALSVGAGIAFGPQYGFALFGAAAIYWGLRLAWDSNKKAKKKGAEDGR